MHSLIQAVLVAAVIPFSAAAQTVEIFTKKTDRLEHILSGGACPGTILTIPLFGTHYHRDDGTDVSCHYGRTRKPVISIFFTDYGALDFETVFARAEQEMVKSIKRPIDQRSSDFCEETLFKGLDDQASNLGLPKIRMADCSMILLDEGMSSLLGAIRIERWTFKVRVTSDKTAPLPPGYVVAAGLVALLAQRRLFSDQ